MRNNMTRQRWQVLHVATGLGHRWVAQPEEDGPGTVFDTWREAVGYADRMSRTVEVTLPRKPGQIRIGRRTHAMVTQEKNGGTALYVLNDSGEDQIIFMKAKYIQPLALALLAHHHGDRGWRVYARLRSPVTILEQRGAAQLVPRTAGDVYNLAKEKA